MKPELLLPAGSIEAFFAAIEGGADAVYLGLNNFNARGRASNFNLSQLEQIIDIAEKNNIKIYLTLNTVIKNEELPELLDILFVLSKSNISAVIIQDWGVYYLIKKHFPQIKVHASTQMVNHNSAGAIFSEKHGFERIILARELLLNELQEKLEHLQQKLESQQQVKEELEAAIAQEAEALEQAKGEISGELQRRRETEENLETKQQEKESLEGRLDELSLELSDAQNRSFRHQQC